MTLTIKAPAWRKRFAEPPRMAMVLITAELLLDLVDRANPGDELTVEWGEPTEHRSGDPPIYEPTFTTHGPRRVRA